jgi:TonB family protein
LTLDRSYNAGESGRSGTGRSRGEQSPEGKEPLRPERLLVATCFLLTASVAVPAPTGPECARLRLHELSLGMSSREVRDRMGGKGDVQGDKKRVRYLRGDSTLWVEFDDEAGKRSARLISIRSHTPTRGDDSAILSAIREQLGEPTRGQQSFAAGLREGPALWSRADCGVEIRATREEPDWWDPGKGGIVVEARKIPIVAAQSAEPTSTTTESPPPPVVPAPAVNEPKRDEPTGETDRASSDGAEQPAAVEPGESSPPTIAVAGAGGVTFPERLPRYYVRPVYPRAARVAKVSGTVYLDVIVRGDGTVGEITVVDSTRTGSGFEDAAIAAVKQWRYRPAMRGAQPVDASILVRVDFQ